MGTLDTILIVGGLGVAAWYIITNKDTLFPPVNPEPEPVVDPGGDGGGGGNGGGNGGGGGGSGGGDGSYDCAKACRNCWCKSYSEKCDGKCSHCCGGSRIASKCGGQGVKSCGGGGSSGGGGGGGDGFALRADVLGHGLGRYQSYEDMYYPHNNRAMRISIA